MRVPAFTVLKLPDIRAGPNDPNCESLDIHAPAKSPAFRAGNTRFVTKKLSGCAKEAPDFQHGCFTKLRKAVLNHFGDADALRAGFLALDSYGRDCVIEILKSLQVLPPARNAAWSSSAACCAAGRPLPARTGTAPSRGILARRCRTLSLVRAPCFALEALAQARARNSVK